MEFSLSVLSSTTGIDENNNYLWLGLKVLGANPTRVRYITESAGNGQIPFKAFLAYARRHHVAHE